MLFYRSRALYRKADRVYPGGWGNMVLGIGPKHGAYLREYAFEKIRSVEFAAYPSRMKSAFAFENCEFAISWKRGDYEEYVYIVEVVDKTLTVHSGDMAWVDAVPHCRSFESLDECARRYWRGEERTPGDRAQFELLVEGELLIIERVTKLLENGAKVTS